jgi:peroxiredoxin family protein
MDMVQNAAIESAALFDGKTILLFSDDLDKALAAFVIANGAVAMESPVTLFFAFWGLNILRKRAPSNGKDLLSRMFGFMMPRGCEKLKLSRLNMMGMGTGMMKYVMRKKNVKVLPELIASAMDSGVRFVACSMSMEVMGISKEEMIEGVEVGGVATFLGAAEKSNMTLFI